MQPVDPGDVIFGKEELAFLNPVYATISRLASQAHLANFFMTIEHVEGSPCFREMVGAIKETDILPGYFIGMRFLVACASDIEEFNSGLGDKKLRDFLHTEVNMQLSGETLADLKAWMTGLEHAKNRTAVTGDNKWEKIGALAGMISSADLMVRILDEYDEVGVGDLFATHPIVMDSVRGAYPSLDALYDEKAKVITTALAQLAVPAPVAPVPPAP